MSNTTEHKEIKANRKKYNDEFVEVTRALQTTRGNIASLRSQEQKMVDRMLVLQGKIQMCDEFLGGFDPVEKDEQPKTEGVEQKEINNTKT